MVAWLSDQQVKKLESIGKLISLNAIATCGHKVDEPARYLRDLNPYAKQRYIERGLKVVDLETAKVFSEVLWFGKTPDWVSAYIDPQIVHEIAEAFA
jgi:hypothetical protein